MSKSLSVRQKNQFTIAYKSYVDDLQSLEAACAKAGISKSTYYRFKKRLHSKKINNKRQIGGKKNVNKVHNESDSDIGECTKNLVSKIRETTKY